MYPRSALFRRNDTEENDSKIPGGTYDVFENPVANEFGDDGAALSTKTFDTFVKSGFVPVESVAKSPPPVVPASLRTKSFAVKSPVYVGDVQDAACIHSSSTSSSCSCCETDTSPPRARAAVVIGVLGRRTSSICV